MMPTRSKILDLTLAAAAVLSVSACASLGKTGLRACPRSTPHDAHPYGPADATRLPGEYTLMMVATTPDLAGHSVRGRLSLWRWDPNAGPIRTVLGPVAHPNYPAVGALDVDAKPLRARVFGHPESHEPTNPGVRITASGRWVFETQYALDAAQLSVAFTEATRDGFRGRWTSWGTPLVQPVSVLAEGYFCAIRVSDDR
jgi:hypothetical protein